MQRRNIEGVTCFRIVFSAVVFYDVIIAKTPSLTLLSVLLSAGSPPRTPVSNAVKEKKTDFCLPCHAVLKIVRKKLKLTSRQVACLESEMITN